MVTTGATALGMTGTSVSRARLAKNGHSRKTCVRQPFEEVACARPNKNKVMVDWSDGKHSPQSCLIGQLLQPRHAQGPIDTTHPAFAPGRMDLLAQGADPYQAESDPPKRVEHVDRISIGGEPL